VGVGTCGGASNWFNGFDFECNSGGVNLFIGGEGGLGSRGVQRGIPLVIGRVVLGQKRLKGEQPKQEEFVFENHLYV